LILTAGAVDTQEVQELAAPVQETGGRASAGAVGEVELDLRYAMSRADGVDRHRDLHAEAVSERQYVFERSPSQRSLPGDGRARALATAPINGPAREREREAEATADTNGEGRDRHIGIPRSDHVDQCRKLDRRVAEIAVAENEYRF